MSRVSTSAPSSVRVGSVGDVPASRWQALVGPTGFYTGHAWLRSLELAYGAGEILMALRDGRVVGAAPTWDGDRAEGALFELPRLADGLPGPWDEPFPCLADADLRPRVLADLVVAARARAAELGRAGVVWPYLPAAAARELAACHAPARGLWYDILDSRILSDPPVRLGLARRG